MRRFFLSMGALATAILLPTLTPIVSGQTSTTAAKPGPPSVPKTAWGEPDLQGIWTDVYLSPFQRPAKYAGREFFTEEERRQLDESRAKRLHRDFRATQGTVADVAGAYNEIFRTRKHTGRRTSMIVDPPDGRMPPFTPEVQKRRQVYREYELALLQASDACKTHENSCNGGQYLPPSPKFLEPSPIYPTTGVNRSDGPEDHGLIVRCLAGFMPSGGNAPSFADANYNDIRRIVQTPGGISMFYDVGQGQGWQRNIVMNRSPHVPSNVRQWWGDSRGHWEGNTLVIDVTNFTAKTDFFGSRENLHVVERFTRTGPTTMDYTVTMEDPTTWTKPWTVKTELTKQNEEANRLYTEPRCHEGNYGLPGLLRGARAEDKAFAEGKGPNPATICTTGCVGVGEDAMDTGDEFQ